MAQGIEHLGLSQRVGELREHVQCLPMGVGGGVEVAAQPMDDAHPVETIGISGERAEIPVERERAPGGLASLLVMAELAIGMTQVQECVREPDTGRAEAVVKGQGRGQYLAALRYSPASHHRWPK